jgi:hypothetical protein
LRLVFEADGSTGFIRKARKHGDATRLMVSSWPGVERQAVGGNAD